MQFLHFFYLTQIYLSLFETKKSNKFTVYLFSGSAVLTSNKLIFKYTEVKALAISEWLISLVAEGAILLVWSTVCLDWMFCKE